MRCNRYLSVIAAVLISAAVVGCAGPSEKASNVESANTTAQIETDAEIAANSSKEMESSDESSTTAGFSIDWETISPDEIDPAIYKMTGGLWYYTDNDEEKSIDMDGLKGLTTYTPEAIPEYEGYLQYLGENPDGLHTFDVLDMSGRQFMTLTFVSEEQFYVDNDENEYYVKWDY